MQAGDAEIMAIKAVGWMAENQPALDRFLAETGEDGGSIGERLPDPEFLAAIIDHLLSSDESVREFCAAHQIPPEAPMRARTLLPGGDAPNWT